MIHTNSRRSKLASPRAIHFMCKLGESPWRKANQGDGSNGRTEAVEVSMSDDSQSSVVEDDLEDFDRYIGTDEQQGSGVHDRIYKLLLKEREEHAATKRKCSTLENEKLEFVKNMVEESRRHRELAVSQVTSAVAESSAAYDKREAALKNRFENKLSIQKIKADTQIKELNTQIKELEEAKKALSREVAIERDALRASRVSNLAMKKKMEGMSAQLKVVAVAEEEFYDCNTY